MKFNFPKKPAQIMLFLGRPNSGKSYCIKSIIYNFRDHFKFGMCITGTKFNNDYDYIPDKYIIDNYNEEYLKSYVDNLKKIREGKKELQPNFLIIDDMLGKIDLYSNFWINLISIHRHLNMYIFFACQYLKAKGSATILRETCNYAFMYRSVYQNTVKSLYEAFGGLFDTYEEFKKVLNETTKEKYNCLLFINGKDDIENSYFKFKAKLEDENFLLDY